MKTNAQKTYKRDVLTPDITAFDRITEQSEPKPDRGDRFTTQLSEGSSPHMLSEPSLDEKLRILADAAKYDVACTSSGVDRKGKEGYLGNARACGICHSFASDGRCISLLKILMTNHCVYDCKYCINRVSNDVERATFTPDEICQLTIEFYKRNYIEGLFLSSGVIKNPTYTMEKMCETLALLRDKYHFNGYIHVKHEGYSCVRRC